MSNPEYERGFAAGFEAGFKSGRGAGVLGGYQVVRAGVQAEGLTGAQQVDAIRQDCGRIEAGACGIANCCRRGVISQRYVGAGGM